MKKVTLSLILFLCASFGFGQVQYSNYLDRTSEWRYYKLGAGAFGGS